MIRSDSAAVKTFWAAFCQQTGVSPDVTYHPRTFSDPRNSTVTDEIAELARQGKKRGTAHLALDFEKNQIPQRKPGEYMIVLNVSLEPQCVVRCTNIALTPFRDVTEEFAASEGEGDLSLEYWATVHKRYFLKQLAEWDMEWDDKLEVVCESFELDWPEPPSPRSSP